MNEYNVEHGSFDITPLQSGFMKKEDFVVAHEGLVIPCHDVFIEMNGGILLINRLNVPAKNIIWPLGGRIQRGVPVEESLRERIRGEAQIELSDIEQLGIARTFWKTDPFGHGKGTDTLNMVFYAKGIGTLQLDDLHDSPMFVTKEKYEEMRDELHPYVQEFMDLAIAKLP